ncbi:hypothetical protein C900_00137 [Fulvivirga imtechensis AK7]|uniref:STAS/SEC14 domain-containing protein n=1 Tax=Fulvivirga imtechensis AK7 TaxID=1237149 RepID=L8K0R0_9BACT|nr:hypothetical protein [Fulvivirga imtechensis]ELR73057.1 hypothetical protein C900_00137 [Fulvivirga imtechensis AK7]
MNQISEIKGKSLLREKNLEVTYDPDTNILFCRWIGFQNKEKIMTSGKKILELFKQQKNCAKILNDNREVTGPWQDAAEWTAKEWFPQMEKAGLKHFAWIFSDNIFAELSAKSAQPSSDIVTTFKSFNEAVEWLNSKP